MSDYIIEVKNISKILKGKIVLDNISIAFERGKIYGIVGSNASGKTMLFRALSGLLYLNSGEVIYNPSDIQMGVIVENPGFLFSYTGFENLKFLASIKKNISDLEIQEAIEKVGLNPSDKRKVKEYSLGMKQKLAIAQAIMESPDVLILDEPTRGLDQESVSLIRSLLLDINTKKGTTILISSHNAEDISVLCNEVLLMKEGRIV